MAMYEVVFIGDETMVASVPKLRPTMKGERLMFSATYGTPLKLPVPGRAKISTVETAYSADTLTGIGAEAKWAQLNPITDKYVLQLKISKNVDGHWLERLVVHAPMSVPSVGIVEVGARKKKFSDTERVLCI